MLTYYQAKTGSDFQFIASLFCPPNTKYWRTKTQTPAALKRNSGPNRRHYILMAGQNKIGWFNLHKTFDSQERFFGIIIDKPFWGQGYGQQAMKLIEKEAKKLGIKKLKLDVNEKNIRALRLYRGSGYKRVAKSIEMEKKI